MLEDMDLTSPLRSLIPSLDSAVLEVLARTESGLSVSAVSRLATRGSRQGLGLALDRLVEHGLVEAEPANQGFLYRLNREHVLVGAVLLATNARLMTIELLKGAFEGLDPAPVHVSIFGSFARADGGPESDIDLFVVASRGTDVEAESWVAQLHEIGDRVTAFTGNRAEMLVLEAESLVAAATSGERLIDLLLEESVALVGSELRQVLGELIPTSNSGNLSGSTGTGTGPSR